MHTGSELVETWIPVGGFKIERRRVRTQDGGATVTECLVPKWDIGELDPDQPCARQPCLHRLVADCLPEREPILALEPVNVWRREIRELKAVGDLWDRIAAGDRRGEEMLERRLAIGLARAPFHLAAVRENGSGFRMRYRPATLRAALWQRLAGEVAGLILCTRCSAPRCGRWFLKGDASRIDKQFCSAACRIRAFRQQGVGVSGGS